MAKYNVHAGHNPDGKKACGAVGLIKESTEARKVKELVIKYLKEQGHTVYDCTVDNGTSKNDVLNKIVAKCNAHDVDLDISIHFNSGAKDKKGNGKSTGTEVFIYSASSKAKDEATNICNELDDLGFKNRGTKINGNLKVLRKTEAPALLIEVCFVDDKDDVDLYKANVDKVARAIVKGITGQEVADKKLLEVTGIWDEATTRRAQEVFRTPVDGKVSNQDIDYKEENPGLTSTFEWKVNPGKNGSILIKTIQEFLNKTINAGLTVDGMIGPKTIKAMQKWLDTVIDGYISNPSIMVKAFQKWLNEQ
jgi:N-acetylmuramoyl-L-alanine amidase